MGRHFFVSAETRSAIVASAARPVIQKRRFRFRRSVKDRPIPHRNATSALRPFSTVEQTSWDVADVPILLQKSAAVLVRWLPRFWERPVILLLWGAGQ
jgi:hypothetical protein